MGSHAGASLEIQRARTLSRFLRIMGAHLDENAARTFAIFGLPVLWFFFRELVATQNLRLSPKNIGKSIGGGFHRVLFEPAEFKVNTNLPQKKTGASEALHIADWCVVIGHVGLRHTQLKFRCQMKAVINKNLTKEYLRQTS